MKVSLNWLKNYIHINVDVDEIVKKLTLVGIEVEEVDYIGSELPNIVVGKVLEKKKHPDADKLSVCIVDIGTDDPLSIVCGAPNVARGMSVPVAPIGAVLPGDFKIKKAKLRGVESSGMICSQKELGVSDDHEGIWDLGAIDSPAGTPLKEALQLESDVVFDLSITPNRPDCLSVIGVARELAAVFGLELKKPATEIFESKKDVNDLAKVSIDVPGSNPRYAARVIENIKIGPSPAWMQNSLIAAGMRPINNIVDITNYVMLEVGHPLHAFDYELLAGHEIRIRHSKANEKFTTLDDKEHKLPVDTIMICDGEKAVALGGIMGGQNSEVTVDTKTILLESAYFTPEAIRSNAKALGISSESSQRFERGADPNAVIYAINRAAAFMSEFAGGEVASGIIDVYPNKIDSWELPLRHEKIKQILGIDIPEEKLIELLGSIQITFDGKMAVIPTFRPDLVREIDLVEEIARLYGLDNIPGKETVEIRYDFPVNKKIEFIDRLKSFLVNRRLFEVITNTMVAGNDFDELVRRQSVPVMNPLSDDMKYMRTQLIGSLLKVCAHNQNRQVSDVQIFEVGKIFFKNSKSVTGSIENWELGILLSGQIFPEQWGLDSAKVDIFYMKSIVEDLLWQLRSISVKYKKSNIDYLTETQLEVKIGKKTIGTFGHIKPEIARKYGVTTDVIFASFNIDALLKIENLLPQYVPVSRFPSVRKDLAVIVSKETNTGTIKDFILAIGGEFLSTVDTFDLFSGKHLKSGEKSIAFKLLFQSNERTLTEEEVNEKFEEIISKVTEEFNARLRGR